jgi:hypothetical protein
MADWNDWCCHECGGADWDPLDLELTDNLEPGPQWLECVCYCPGGCGEWIYECGCYIDVVPWPPGPVRDVFRLSPRMWARIWDALEIAQRTDSKTEFIDKCCDVFLLLDQHHAVYYLRAGDNAQMREWKRRRDAFQAYLEEELEREESDADDPKEPGDDGQEVHDPDAEPDDVSESSEDEGPPAPKPNYD